MDELRPGKNHHINV